MLQGMCGCNLCRTALSLSGSVWRHASWARVVTVVVIAVNVLLPLRYYLLVQYDDPLDEAYAFRMFSDTSHASSVANWYLYTATSDAVTIAGGGGGSASSEEPLELSTEDFVERAGMSRAWAQAATGEFPRKGRVRYGPAPALWLMDRIAGHLCEVVEPRPAAVAARRIVLPWHGDEEEKVLSWKC